MADQYEIGRSDEGPSRDRGSGRWNFLWEAIVEAFGEGYRGWITVEFPNGKKAKAATAALSYRGRVYQMPIEVSYRGRKGGSYTLFARLLETEEMSNGEDM